MKLSFRNRIAWFSAFAAALTIGLVFLALYGVVFWTAYRHLDSDIIQEKREVMRSIQWKNDSLHIGDMKEWEEEEHREIEVNPTFLQLVDLDGGVLFRSANLQLDTLHHQPFHLSNQYVNSLIGVKRIRQGQFPVINPAGVMVGQLIVGISREESAIILDNLRQVLLVSFPLMLLILFIATSIAAAKGIAPVQHLIHSAQTIGDADFHSRLPLPENQDELYQLAMTINALLHRIDQGVQREKQFTSDASHEIRTPLTAIRGTLEVLLRKPREREYYQEKVKGVIQEVDRIQNMLDQLLQLARLENGSVATNAGDIDLVPFLQDLKTDWTARLEERQMQMSIDILSAVQIHTDATLLTLILDNLISNAWKYGREGGKIVLSWHAEYRQLVVSDDGPGISTTHSAQVFDRFYRLDNSRSSSVPGAGLGLSIARKMAEVLGLGLRLVSREGEGTSFILDFHDKG